MRRKTRWQASTCRCASLPACCGPQEPPTTPRWREREPGRYDTQSSRGLSHTGQSFLKSGIVPKNRKIWKGEAWAVVVFAELLHKLGQLCCVLSITSKSCEWVTLSKLKQCYFWKKISEILVELNLWQPKPFHWACAKSALFSEHGQKGTKACLSYLLQICELVKFMIDHCQQILGEDPCSMFGGPPQRLTPEETGITIYPISYLQPG